MFILYDIYGILNLIFQFWKEIYIDILILYLNITEKKGSNCKSPAVSLNPTEERHSVKSKAYSNGIKGVKLKTGGVFNRPLLHAISSALRS